MYKKQDICMEMKSGKAIRGFVLPICNKSIKHMITNALQYVLQVWIGTK